MPDPIRVLVIDDSAFMRNALTRNIERDSRFKVIGTAVDGRDGVDKALRLKPDVVTLDVEMPVMNGLEALREIVARSSIPVVMVSSMTEAGAKTTMEALEIGAVDFIPKAKGADLIHETLLAAVHANPAARPAPLFRPPRPAPLFPPPRPASGPPPPFPLATRRPEAAVYRGTPKIIVIGSSTGGPQALHALIGALPPNLPVPVVIAQHMPPQFTLALAKRLDACCPPKVVEATHGEPLVGGTVYIGPGGMQIRVTPTSLRVDPDKGESLYKPSVDVLAESALAAFGKHVLGVMLTGMGNDGMREFSKLHRAGAYNLVQDQASCVVYGMPRAVAEAGGADEVLPLDKIGQRIVAMLRLDR